VSESNVSVDFHFVVVRSPTVHFITASDLLNF